MNNQYINTIGKNILRYPPGATYGPRKNELYEFIWIVRGQGKIEIDDESFNALPNSVLLLRPNQQIFFEWDPKKTTIQGFIHFQFIKPIPNLPLEKDWPTHHILNEEDDILLPLLKYIVGISDQENPTAKLLLESAMLQAIITFINQWTHPQAISLSSRNSTISDLYRTINKILESPVHPPISLKKLADQTQVTPEYLCRLTRKELNTTPMELVYKLKIDKGAQLLSRTEFPIKKIAELCSFQNVYHFSRRFKKTTGVPPAKYRTLANLGIVTPSSKFEISRPTKTSK